MSTLPHGELRERPALSPAPESQQGPVKAWSEAVTAPPYGQAIHLENEFVRLMLLPEMGGRIQLGLDKTTGYEFFSRQSNAIFGWPHADDSSARFPVSTYIEEHPDGSKTVWCGYYDPTSRMKGMHGVCLYPGRAYVEMKVRLFNRTPLAQSFLWPADSLSGDFSCRYDPDLQAGIVHIADQYPQDSANFSFLAPYETKAFSQFWYPIGTMGPARKANLDAAVSWRIQNESMQIGVCVTRAFPKAMVAIEHGGNVLAQWTRDLHPAMPFVEESILPADARSDELTLKVLTSAGRLLMSYTPGEPEKTGLPAPLDAGPLPSPKKVETVEQLYLIGLQLRQRRNAARQPEDYWREGLRREEGDSRCHNALGLWQLQRGNFLEAEAHFRQAIATLTARNSQAYDCEPFYNLGLTLRYGERDEEAYDAFHRASGSFSWRAPSLYALAELDTKRGNYGAAPKRLYEALRLNADNNNARNLAAALFRRFGRNNEAEQLLRESLALDPLDAWACYGSGRPIPGDNQTRLDLAFDYGRAGLYQAAIEVLTAADLFVEDGSLPAVHYALASFYTRTGDLPSAQREYLAAAQSSPERFSPHRIEEMVVLARAVALQPHDARAQYYLANLLYGLGRYEEALELWESSAALDGSLAAVWRNLGIGYYNIRNDMPKAFEAFDKALAADGADARILYERDQLWKRAGVPPAIRLKEFEARPSLAESHDDLAMQWAALSNDINQPPQALALLSSRPFQPGESGNGMALEQYVRANLKLGRQALKTGDPMRALNLFFAALHSPASLGGAQHRHAHAPEIWFWLGEAHHAAQERSSAREYWRKAADLKVNVREISGGVPSEMVFYSGLALDRLGDRFASRKLLRELWFAGRKLAREKPKGEELTALPALHQFKEDGAKRSRATGLFLQAQARLGLGQYKLARRLLDGVLALNPNHGRALDLTAELPPEK